MQIKEQIKRTRKTGQKEVRQVAQSRDMMSKTAVTVNEPNYDLKTGNSLARKLLSDWLHDESGYDEETWPTLKQALERNRSTFNRKLYND